MSHRVTIKSAITNGPAAKAALNSKGWTFLEQGDSLRITSGPMNRATINLKNGEVVGDTDYHQASSTDSLGALNQAYTHELLKLDIANQGGFIEETLVQNGEIHVTANVSFA